MASRRTRPRTPAQGSPDSNLRPGKSARGVARRRKLIEAAVELFSERGYAATSMDDVAEAVGILKGSLYYYIETKEDLLYGIVQEVHADVQALLDEAMTRTDLTPIGRLLLFVRLQVVHNARNAKKIGVYHHDWRQLQDERMKDVLARRRVQEEEVAVLLEEAKKAGEAHKNLDTKLATNSVFSTIIWPYTWYRPGRVSAAQLADFCADFIYGGVTQPAPDAGES